MFLVLGQEIYKVAIFSDIQGEDMPYFQHKTKK